MTAGVRFGSRDGAAGLAAIDSVSRAAADPEREQPYAELGLTTEEYQRIRGLLGRRPTSAELAMYSVMWSEHCSYKSSKLHLRQFGTKAPASARMLVGMGENAGVVDVGGGHAVTFKIESHNHPSYVEPYQGAATGVGGIVRDILTMGARPVAVLDPLRFGPADAPGTARVLPGVVAGVGGYGNCLGVPTIGGELVFDPRYAGNPLVNVLCVGVLPADGVKYAKAEGVGNQVVLFGAHTGGDGIGGASVLASATFDAGGRPAKRPSVQVGDPFTEKLLIECCLQIFAEDLVVGIQDLGAAGISCATTELASAGGVGMSVDLDAVPLRDPTLAPEEILMSESQERMCAVVEPAKLPRFKAICERWGIPATVVGEVIGGDNRLRITWRGELVVDVPPATVAHGGPVYDRPRRRPAHLDALQADSPDRLPRPSDADGLRADLLRLVADPEFAAKRWVTEQYDAIVGGNTVLAGPHDAGVIRVDETTGRGVAITADGNHRACRLDPYAGTQAALAEAYRNVAAAGAVPVAVTNCLNFGSPEDPEVMWQFAQATSALADGCLALGTPVTGGNVSFYNQTGTTPIDPTPVVGMLGVFDDVSTRTGIGCGPDGTVLVLLGETRPEFGGSAWAAICHDHVGGTPPPVDLGAERSLGRVLTAAALGGLLAGAHDLAAGGLAISVVESCLAGDRGVALTLPVGPPAGGLDGVAWLFAESGARAIVWVAPDDVEQVESLACDEGVAVRRLGVVGGDALRIRGVADVELVVPVSQLREASEATLPALFD